MPWDRSWEMVSTGIYWYVLSSFKLTQTVWMDINKRHLQYINTTVNSMAKSRKTYWGVLAFWKSVDWNKFCCLVNEILFIRDLKPTLNVQSDSIRARVHVLIFILIIVIFSIYIYFQCNIRYVILSDAYNKDIIIIIIIIISFKYYMLIYCITPYRQLCI